MKEFKVQDFPNLADQIKPGSIEIEEIIKDFQLEFSQTRDSNVEWKMKFPMFVPSFYSFIIKRNTIPKQPEFWDYYREHNSDWFKENTSDRSTVKGLKARVLRSYPSLVRDVHFTKFLRERSKSAEIIYNTDLDIKHGIDLMIIYKGRNYAVNLYTQTSRAFIGRHKKAFRHEEFSNAVYIELPVNFEGSRKSGEFFLYGERERIDLRNILMKES